MPVPAAFTVNEPVCSDVFVDVASTILSPVNVTFPTSEPSTRPIKPPACPFAELTADAVPETFIVEPVIYALPCPT